MDTNTLQKTLANTAIPEFRFYPSIGSTNDAAADWAKQGAPELAVVIADEQTAGRGRAGRQWYTPPGSSLAFSMILHPSASNSAHLTALGALAVCTSLQQDYLLPAEIKWPNDVLVHAKKVCGVLVEVSWQGEKMEYAILGIGVNVNRNSIIKKKPLNFPATDIETELGKEVERVSLLASILRKLLEFKSHLGDEFFLSTWQQNLAYINKTVNLKDPQANILQGVLVGLSPEGSIRLRLESGEVKTIHVGELQLIARQS